MKKFFILTKGLKSIDRKVEEESAAFWKDQASQYVRNSYSLIQKRIEKLRRRYSSIGEKYI